jgi:hypothetical protein
MHIESDNLVTISVVRDRECVLDECYRVAWGKCEPEMISRETGFSANVSWDVLRGGC